MTSLLELKINILQMCSLYYSCSAAEIVYLNIVIKRWQLYSVYETHYCFHITSHSIMPYIRYSIFVLYVKLYNLHIIFLIIKPFRIEHFFVFYGYYIHTGEIHFTRTNQAILLVPLICKALQEVGLTCHTAPLWYLYAS